MFPQALLTTKVDLDEIHDDENQFHDADPGVGEIQGGYGSASLHRMPMRDYELNPMLPPLLPGSSTSYSGEGSRDTKISLLPTRHRL